MLDESTKLDFELHPSKSWECVANKHTQAYTRSVD